MYVSEKKYYSRDIITLRCSLKNEKKRIDYFSNFLMLDNELQKKYSEQVLYLEGRGRKEGFHLDERLQVDSSHI